MRSRENSFSGATSDQDTSSDAVSEPDRSKGISQGGKNNLMSLWNECPAGLLNAGKIRD